MMNRKEVLASLVAGKITEAHAFELLGKLEQAAADAARTAAAAARATADPRRLWVKVSEKGAVSIYGLQRMPVTLYVEQWERLLQFVGDLTAKDKDGKEIVHPGLISFLKANDALLSRKPVREEADDKASSGSDGVANIVAKVTAASNGAGVNEPVKAGKSKAGKDSKTPQAA